MTDHSRADGQHDDHDHDHEQSPHHHGHHHEHSDLPSDEALRVKAIETILIEQGIVDPSAIDAAIDYLEKHVGPKNGAQVVARAWLEPDFCELLRKDATAAAASMGFTGQQTGHLVAVENASGVHNLITCTLCSCYPVALLGLPPAWYKSESYRSRSVVDPRGVLAEFGLRLSADTHVRVWDSTAEQRYIVIPERPAGTEGWSIAELASIVTRNSMIGTEILLPPTISTGIAK